MASVQASTSVPESALPLRKRKAPEDAEAADAAKATTTKLPATMNKAREIRLEQNRKVR